MYFPNAMYFPRDTLPAFSILETAIFGWCGGSSVHGHRRAVPPSVSATDGSWQHWGDTRRGHGSRARTVPRIRTQVRYSLGIRFIHIITREICHTQSVETAFWLSAPSWSEMRQKQQGENTINSSSLPSPSNRWYKQNTKIILEFFKKCTLICTLLLTKFG